MTTKVQIINNTIVIPSTGKRSFLPNVSLTKEQFFECLEFAKNMAYWWNHKTLAFGGNNYNRNAKEVFINALQWKLAEVGFYNFYTNKWRNDIPKPDFWVWERWTWEDCDMEIWWKKISIKSTKNFWNLLLLEKNRYSMEWLYLEPAEWVEPIKYDLTYLVRVSGITSSNPDDYVSMDWIEIEVTWYLTHTEFLSLITTQQYIPHGILLWKKELIVDNYYICSWDLHRV